jgi:hypothetical protein
MLAHSLSRSFRHRQNPDGSWDSICMRCYLTAAHTFGEKLLSSVESGHCCDEASWLFKESAGLRVGSRSPRMDHLSIPSRSCPPSAMPRARQFERIQFSQSRMRLSGRPAGLREQAAPERRSEA